MCADNKTSCNEKSCNCHKQGPQIKGFLIPCLLMLLEKESSHGYQLIDSLGNLNYYINLPDPGVIYRHLRKLEKEEMISSKLVEGGGGPARKVYSITDQGKQCLVTWKSGLKSLKASIDGLLSDLD